MPRPQAPPFLLRSPPQLRQEKAQSTSLRHELLRLAPSPARLGSADADEGALLARLVGLLGRGDEAGAPGAARGSPGSADAEALRSLQDRLGALSCDPPALLDVLREVSRATREAAERRSREAEGAASRAARDKAALENSLEAEAECMTNRLSRQLGALEDEAASLRGERAELRRSLAALGGEVERLRRDRVALESLVEQEEESVVNRLQRQLQAVTAAYHALESRLESAGLAPDPGTPRLDATIDWVYGRSPSRDRALGARPRSRSRSSTSSFQASQPDLLRRSSDLSRRGLGLHQAGAESLSGHLKTPSESPGARSAASAALQP